MGEFNRYRRLNRQTFAERDRFQGLLAMVQIEGRPHPQDLATFLLQIGSENSFWGVTC